MATTDARTGFRLPWSSDQRPATDETPTAGGDDTAPSGWGDPAGDGSGAPGGPDQAAEGRNPADAVDAEVGARPAKGGPSKFLADLTRAMQATAETAREETLGRLAADTKTHIEEIHARSATESNDLRRRADDDVAAIREWSKAEIARIREETESRIAERKSRLELEIEEHAGLIERQIERVQSRVATFETEMAAFFEQLLREEDPTRFASMAQNLPEPPPFDLDDWPTLPDHESGVPESGWAGTASGFVEGTEGAAGWVSPEGVDAEGAMAAIQAAAEAAAEAERAALAGAQASDEFAAAEAEALAAAGNGEEMEIPTIPDEALAARLAVLVPAPGEESASENQSTQVVVNGLVSVASIASFKRHLGRVSGVQSVGVSSGPDGEFIFAVAHGAGVSFLESIPKLPGFQARVTGSAPGVVEVTAHDPESEG